MTTDTIREDKNEFWMGFRAGYQQGRRFLIESMHVVGYRYYDELLDDWVLVDNPASHAVSYPVYLITDEPKT